MTRLYGCVMHMHALPFLYRSAARACGTSALHDHRSVSTFHFGVRRMPPIMLFVGLGAGLFDDSRAFRTALHLLGCFMLEADVPGLTGSCMQCRCRTSGMSLPRLLQPRPWWTLSLEAACRLQTSVSTRLLLVRGPVSSIMEGFLKVTCNVVSSHSVPMSSSCRSLEIHDLGL